MADKPPPASHGRADSRSNTPPSGGQSSSGQNSSGQASGGEQPQAALDPAQYGSGDMDAEAFRRHGRDVIDWIADYFENVGDRPVLAQVSPGEVRAQLPDHAPNEPEAFSSILGDVDRIVMPGITHWNHPAFHAYFAITGSGPGILAETLIAALNVNGMLWRTSPSATELEELVVDWMRDMMGLQADWRGMITDSASMSTLVSLAAAREGAGFDIRQRGMTGRSDLPMLTVYASEQAHSSVEKAAITLGLGRDAMRHVPTDASFRMDPSALEAMIAADIAAGHHPLATVATVGTTSTTSIDPVPAIADVHDRVAATHGRPMWLHVDGAYAGVAAIHPDHRYLVDGVDRADSFVTNPHKWLFTPIDASLLLVKDPAALVNAFALSAEYLTTDDDQVTDYMDWGVQLGRRFRALKLWMVLRYFGRDGIARRIAEHINQAAEFAERVKRHPDLVLVAPVPLSTVCFRAEPSWAGDDPAQIDALNRTLLSQINRSGEAYLSHTVVAERYVLRLAVGNLRTTSERLDATFGLITATLDALRGAPAWQ
ncbi:MAG: pyridoxal-dependent decarboxylase [Nitriliruptoraceae bacterium]